MEISKSPDLSELKKTIKSLKNEGKSIGLCCGGYDLLHAGHVAHFNSAKKLCDVLVVAVTCDKFVNKKKGAGRPIFDEKQRAYLVSNIKAVDFSLIGPYETAVELIKELKPNYYIKGSDYANRNTPGITAEREVIQSIGGKILYTDDEKLSTTDIIKYIQEKARRERLLVILDRDGTLIEEVDFLGKNRDWIDRVRLNKAIVDLLITLKTKFDTVNVVISNQQGVARGYFGMATVEEINGYISGLLKKHGIVIADWQYCPDVDAAYATAKPGVHFIAEYVKNSTIRKPSPEMLHRALEKIGGTISDFDKVAVLGNNEDDAEMADKLGIVYIDVKNKTFEALKIEFERV